MNFYLPKRKKREPLGLRETPQLRSPSHLKWVRGHDCSVMDQGPMPHLKCGGKIEAAHVRAGTDGAMGVKPSDCFAIPLCSAHHAYQHRIGEKEFEAVYRISMRKIADGLWAKSPHRKAAGS
jgi:hypothetical protein